VIEIFGLIAGLSAIMVITETNTVHSVFYLVLSFISTSIIFILAELDYLGLLVIIIYVGAIAILFLFVVMMINIKVEDQNKARYVPIGVAITLGFIYQAYSAYPKFHEPLIKYDKREE
jgi:NADH-quinone oxidoreductase subunit J